VSNHVRRELPTTDPRICLVVASIEETANRYNISKSFIGLVLLPLVVSIAHIITRALLDTICQANAAEHVTSVWMAMKDKMQLTLGICVGSSIVRSIHLLSFSDCVLIRVGFCVSKSPPSSCHSSWLLAGGKNLMPNGARSRLLTCPVSAQVWARTHPFL
jgi:hypothetical protein